MVNYSIQLVLEVAVLAKFAQERSFWALVGGGFACKSHSKCLHNRGPNLSSPGSWPETDKVNNIDTWQKVCCKPTYRKRGRRIGVASSFFRFLPFSSVFFRFFLFSSVFFRFLPFFLPFFMFRLLPFSSVFLRFVFFRFFSVSFQKNGETPFARHLQNLRNPDASQHKKTL